MVFEGLKRMIKDHKEQKEHNRFVEEDLKIRDEIYRQEARKQAREEFKHDRSEALEHRRDVFREQARAKFDKERARLMDTRTKGEKFHSGLKKLGKGAKRIASDSKTIGGGTFGSLQNLGNKASFNIHSTLGHKQSKKKGDSISDRILRNL